VGAFDPAASANPWRCGVDAHLKPRPGVWDVRPERMPDRTAWIDAYELRAADYAACTYVALLGSGITPPAVASLVKLYDDECRVLALGLPIA